MSDIDRLLEESGVDLFEEDLDVLHLNGGARHLLESGASAKRTVTFTPKQCRELLTIIETAENDPFFANNSNILDQEELDGLGIDGQNVQKPDLGLETEQPLKDPFEQGSSPTSPEVEDGQVDSTTVDIEGSLPDGDQAIPEQTIPSSVLQAQEALDGDSITNVTRTLGRARRSSAPRYEKAEEREARQRAERETQRRETVGESEDDVVRRALGGYSLTESEMADPRSGLGSNTPNTREGESTGTDVPDASVISGLRESRKRRNAGSGRSSGMSPEAVAALACGGAV